MADEAVYPTHPIFMTDIAMGVATALRELADLATGYVETNNAVGVIHVMQELHFLTCSTDMAGSLVPLIGGNLGPLMAAYMQMPENVADTPAGRALARLGIVIAGDLPELADDVAALRTMAGS